MAKLLAKKVKAGKMSLEEVREKYSYWYEEVLIELEKYGGNE